MEDSVIDSISMTSTDDMKHTAKLQELRRVLFAKPDTLVERRKEGQSSAPARAGRGRPVGLVGPRPGQQPCRTQG